MNYPQLFTQLKIFHNKETVYTMVDPEEHYKLNLMMLP